MASSSSSRNNSSQHPLFPAPLMVTISPDEESIRPKNASGDSRLRISRFQQSLSVSSAARPSARSGPMGLNHGPVFPQSLHVIRNNPDPTLPLVHQGSHRPSRSIDGDALPPRSESIASTAATVVRSTDYSDVYSDPTVKLDY